MKLSGKCTWCGSATRGGAVCIYSLHDFNIALVVSYYFILISVPNMVPIKADEWEFDVRKAEYKHKRAGKQVRVPRVAEDARQALLHQPR